MEESFKALKKAFVLSEWIHSHPFVWNDSQAVPEASTSTRHTRLWALNMLTSFVYSNYLQYRFIQVTLDPTASVLQKIYFMFVSIFYSCAAWLQICILFQRHQIPLILQRLNAFLHHVQDELAGCGSTMSMLISKSCRKFMGMCYFAFVANATFMVLMAIARPHFPELLTSLTCGSSVHIISSLLRLAILAVINAYIVYGFLENSVLFLFSILIFICTILDLLSGGTFNNRYMSTPGGLSKSIRCYRALYIQTIDFSQTFAPAYGGIHAGLILLAILCSYGTIRFPFPLSIGSLWICANCSATLAVLIIALASSNQRSKTTLKKMKDGFIARFVGNSKRCRIIRRELATLRDVRIRIGSPCFYDRYLVMTTLKIILESATSLLLLK